MILSSERSAAPEIDSVALETTIAAYQRSRRLLDALQTKRSACETPSDVGGAAADRANVVSFELMHETRIARARLREVVGAIVADAISAGLPKATLVRRINDHVNSLSRFRVIEPEGPILAEIIEWIIERYPSDFVLESTMRGARPTPPHSRDIIPVHLLKQNRVS